MKKQTTDTDAQPVIRTSRGLRDALFDELDALRNGKSTPQKAVAIARLSAHIVDTVRMEIQVQRFVPGIEKNMRALPCVNFSDGE